MAPRKTSQTPSPPAKKPVPQTPPHIPRKQRQIDPDGHRLPIRLDSTSNGEYLPRTISAEAARANHLAHEQASAAARHLGLSRRAFLSSAMGAAGSFVVMNQANAEARNLGGFFNVPKDAVHDAALAQEVMSGGEFIFDVQGHHVNPQGAWRDQLFNQWKVGLRFFPQAGCADDDSIACFSAEHFVREIFLDSDTDLCVLSMVPAGPEDNPLTIEEASATRALVEAMEGDHRLMIHGLVHPQIPGAIDFMQEQAETHQIAAWKTYTQWGPNGKGFWLHDEEFGIPMIEKARSLGVKTICVHKGLPLPGILFGGNYTEFARPKDVGVVAKMFPDMTFIVYHSGYEPDHTEGPYAPDAEDILGVDELVKSLQDNGIAPGGNVYAELGSTWRTVMQDPTQAAHLLGKLLKYVGEDRVLWGTDSIWYGSPQDQIQALRTFEISEEFQEKYGYPALTREIKAKIFGLNAAHGPYKLDPEDIRKRASADTVSRVRAAYLPEHDPTFDTYGPRTRREFFRHLKLSGGVPLGGRLPNGV